MARRVEFVDTSILCNLLEVPGKCQDRGKVIDDLLRKQKARDCDLLLPVTAVIETGNHIAQLTDGRCRRTCAEKFAGVLRMVVEGKAPWTLNEVEWDAAHLNALITPVGEGSTSGGRWPEAGAGRLPCKGESLHRVSLVTKVPNVL